METNVRCTKCKSYLTINCDGVYTCEFCLANAIKTRIELDKSLAMLSPPPPVSVSDIVDDFNGKVK